MNKLCLLVSLTLSLTFSFTSPKYCLATSFYNCSTPITNEDRRINKSKWTITQFNVEWLFTDPYKDCPGDGCSWNTTEQEYIHLHSVADVIQKLDADTIHMCEVQSCTQLRQLIDILPNSGYRAYLKKGTDTYTGQNVGLLTRVDPIAPLERTEDKYEYPIPGNKCNYEDASGQTGVSKHLIADFHINNKTITIIGAHLLSNPNDPTACVKREAQAQILQNIVANVTYNNGAKQRDNNIILLGDFNDFDYEIEDINNNKPNSRVLDILKGNDGDYLGEYSLYSVGNKTNQSNRYTNWYDPNNDCIVETSEYSAIDHILLTDELYGKIDDVYYYHGYEEGCDITNSDHYPIYISITL